MVPDAAKGGNNAHWMNTDDWDAGPRRPALIRVGEGNACAPLKTPW